MLSTDNDVSLFTVKHNAVVQFESTWNSDNILAKGVPIPTQTDDVPANVEKATNTQEIRHKTTQTESFANHGLSTTVNEQRLADSLRGLAEQMEHELNLGTTNVFRFED